MAESRKAVVVFDAINWLEPNPDDAGSPWHRRAFANETVQLPADEYDRLAAMGAVAPPGRAAAARQAVQDLSGVWTDEEIQAGKAEELIAYVTQHPEEAPRVHAAEQARQRPRTTVLKATSELPPGEDDDDEAGDGAGAADDAGDGQQA